MTGLVFKKSIINTRFPDEKIMSGLIQEYWDLCINLSDNTTQTECSAYNSKVYLVNVHCTVNFRSKCNTLYLHDNIIGVKKIGHWRSWPGRVPKVWAPYPDQSSVIYLLSWDLDFCKGRINSQKLWMDCLVLKWFPLSNDNFFFLACPQQPQTLS